MSAAQAVEVFVSAKETALGTFAIEVEVQDFFGADTIDLVHPIFGTFGLALDIGEGNWDIEAEDLDFSEVEAFFDTTFDFQINDMGNQSVYRAARVGPPGPGDFPMPADVLIVTPSANPLRPTAQWVGGDDTADAMIISYATGDDEFTDGFEAAEADGSRTLSFDLAPGFYDAAIGFYFFFGTFPLDLISGDDVLGISEFELASVGETFSGVQIVPVPAAAWLLLSGLGSLVAFRRRKK